MQDFKANIDLNYMSETQLQQLMEALKIVESIAESLISCPYNIEKLAFPYEDRKGRKLTLKIKVDKHKEHEYIGSLTMYDVENFPISWLLFDVSHSKATLDQVETADCFRGNFKGAGIASFLNIVFEQIATRLGANHSEASLSLNDAPKREEQKYFYTKNGYSLKFDNNDESKSGKASKEIFLRKLPLDSK